MNLPIISVNIPLITNGKADIVLKSLKKVDYPKNLIEIIIIEGNHIAKQRNKGLMHSKGEIIYFLDDDSQIRSNAFKILAKEFRNPKVAAVGGPSLTPKENSSYLNQLIGYVLETYFGAFRMRLKWSKVENNSGMDYNFIGANLAMKRKAAINAGGFDEKIVPNEETELLRRLQKSGYILRYNKNLFIYRNHRGNLYLLAKQFYHYGRGRMKQTLKTPVAADFIFVVPILFELYLASLIFIRPAWYYTPLIVYFLLGLITSFKAAIKYKRADLLIAMPPTFLVVHLSYGFGLLTELIKKTIVVKESRRRPIYFGTKLVLVKSCQSKKICLQRISNYQLVI